MQNVTVAATGPRARHSGPLLPSARRKHATEPDGVDSSCSSRRRSVAINSEEQQGVLVLHRARDLIVRQRTQLGNMLRGSLPVFGMVIAQGIGSAINFAKGVLDGDKLGIPEVAVDALSKTHGRNNKDTRITDLEKLAKLFFVIALAVRWAYRCALRARGWTAIPGKAHGRQGKSWFRYFVQPDHPSDRPGSRCAGQNMPERSVSVRRNLVTRVGSLKLTFRCHITLVSGREDV